MLPKRIAAYGNPLFMIHMVQSTGSLAFCTYVQTYVMPYRDAARQRICRQDHVRLMQRAFLRPLHFIERILNLRDA